MISEALAGFASVRAGLFKGEIVQAAVLRALACRRLTIGRLFAVDAARVEHVAFLVAREHAVRKRVILITAHGVALIGAYAALDRCPCILFGMAVEQRVVRADIRLGTAAWCVFGRHGDIAHPVIARYLAFPFFFKPEISCLATAAYAVVERGPAVERRARIHVVHIIPVTARFGAHDFGRSELLCALCRSGAFRFDNRASDARKDALAEASWRKIWSACAAWHRVALRHACAVHALVAAWVAGVFEFIRTAAAHGLADVKDDIFAAACLVFLECCGVARHHAVREVVHRHLAYERLGRRREPRAVAVRDFPVLIAEMRGLPVAQLGHVLVACVIRDDIDLFRRERRGFGRPCRRCRSSGICWRRGLCRPWLFGLRRRGLFGGVIACGQHADGSECGQTAENRTIKDTHTHAPMEW